MQLRLLALMALTVVGLTTIAPGGAWAACVRGVASSDTLRIRSGPDASNSEVGRIPHDACGVQVTGPCRRGWCPVAFRGVSGWSSGRYLAEQSGRAPQQPAPQAQEKLKAAGLCVTGIPPDGALQIRSGPGGNFVALYGFRAGTCGIRITGRCRGVFCPVQYKEFNGWADRRNLR
ncbi:MAG: hypothetical protein RLZ98_3419 [Pseudomonadota bacterium]